MSLLPTIRRLRVAVAAGALLAAALPPQVSALENPQRSVFVAFPEADSYQVITRDVTADARKRIEARVPFRVHFDELGEHSLYVALRRHRPIGMIYAQREESDYGLASVEWAFKTDLSVAGFQFQHVRSKHRRALEQSEFVRMLKGQTREQIAAMLDGEGHLREPAKGVSTEAQGLATTVARSGVKAMAVLEVIWATDIANVHDKAVGLGSFPEAQSFRRIWPPVVAAAGRAEVDSNVVLAVRAFGPQSALLGCVLDVRMQAADETIEVRWVVDGRGVLIDVGVPLAAPRAFRAACNGVEGQELAAVARRGDAIGLALRAASALLEPGARPVR